MWIASVAYAITIAVVLVCVTAMRRAAKLMTPAPLSSVTEQWQRPI